MATAQKRLITSLEQAGLDVPGHTFFSSFPANTSLVKWLADTVEAHNQSKALLTGTEASDTSRSDQAQASPWLCSSTPPEQQAVLAELEQESSMLQAQLRDMQALTAELDDKLQQSRQAHHHLAVRRNENTAILATKRAELAVLNSKLNQQLQQLHNSVRDLAQLLSLHGAQWLLTAANMDVLMAADTMFNEVLNRQLSSMDASHNSNSGTASDAQQRMSQHNPSSAANGNGSMHPREAISLEDPWLAEVDEPGMEAGRQLAPSLTPLEHEAMMAELQRLRSAYCLVELELVQARMQLAGQQGQAEELRRMQREHGSASSNASAPWLHDAERQRVAARVAALEREKASLLHTAVPQLVESLGKLQDTYVLQGDYALRAARHARSISDKRTLVELLLSRGAQCLLLDSLRKHETEQLQVDTPGGLLHMVGELDLTLSSVCSASHTRRSHYASLQLTSSTTPASPKPPLPPSLLQSQPHQPQRSPASYHALRQQQEQRGLVGEDEVLEGVQDALQAAAAVAAAAKALAAAAVAPPALQRTTAPSLHLPTPPDLLWHLSAVLPLPGANPPPRPASQPPLVPQLTLKALTDGLQQLVAHSAAALDLTGTIVSPSQPPASVGHATAQAQACHGLLFERADATMPTMRLPALAEAMGQLEGLHEQLQAAINELVHANNAYASFIDVNKADTMQERRVLTLFHTQPERLQASLAAPGWDIGPQAGQAARLDTCHTIDAVRRPVPRPARALPGACALPCLGPLGLLLTLITTIAIVTTIISIISIVTIVTIVTTIITTMAIITTIAIILRFASFITIAIIMTWQFDYDMAIDPMEMVNELQARADALSLAH
ncbi:hypothetical protein QJQ45_019197 [Haematococcus lacustris]|nr:hypothetical protein QJQ45_019197 [Haematococcus lacustris]